MSSHFADDFETLRMNSRELMDHLGEQEYLPAVFKGIMLNTLGNTRKNPFFKLKEIALDPTVPFHDRTQAIRYMNRIPHVEMLSNVIECACKIINDDRYPIRERYFFFSNNEKYIKLDGHTVRMCHHYYFKISEDIKAYPLILRLLSAEYIYQNEHHSHELWYPARDFIVKLALDKNESVFMRSEAADVLKRKITDEDFDIGTIVINELGSLYQQNRVATIYTNAQNAHNEAITESVMNVVRTLANDPKINPPKKIENLSNNSLLGFSSDNKPEDKLLTTADIYSKIILMPDNIVDNSNNKVPNIRKQKIESAFQHILIYPSRYEGICLSDILVFVWRKIDQQTPELKSELEKRLLDELYDMDQTCGTGYLTRIINTLSGYIQEENLQIKMNINDQLRANIFARLGKSLRVLSMKDQDIILAEIASEESKKEAAIEFLELCSDIKEELDKEFVETKLVSKESFEEIYKKCSDDFIGLSTSTK